MFSNGMTEEEARESFESLVPEQAEYMKERTGEYPEWYDKNVVFDLRAPRFLNEQKNPRSGSRFGDCCVLENIPSSQTDGASLLS